MLTDGIQLVGASKIQREMVNSSRRGPILPLEPVSSQLFQLTETEGTNTPGIYVYSLTEEEWVPVGDTESHPYDIAMSVWGRPMSYRSIAKIVSPRTIIFDEGLIKCKAVCDEASSVRVDFQIKIKNVSNVDTTIGVLTFMPGELIGSFTSSLGHDALLQENDHLFLINEADRDVSLRDLSITLTGRLATL